MSRREQLVAILTRYFPDADKRIRDRASVRVEEVWATDE